MAGTDPLLPRYTDAAVRYVQTGNKIEQILQAIRDAVHSGVEFAEDKLGQVLELLTDHAMVRPDCDKIRAPSHGASNIEEARCGQ